MVLSPDSGDLPPILLRPMCGAMASTCESGLVAFCPCGVSSLGARNRLRRAMKGKHPRGPGFVAPLRSWGRRAEPLSAHPLTVFPARIGRCPTLYSWRGLSLCLAYGRLVLSSPLPVRPHACVSTLAQYLRPVGGSGRVAPRGVPNDPDHCLVAVGSGIEDRRRPDGVEVAASWERAHSTRPRLGRRGCDGPVPPPR